jgi:hypothetical protein
MLARGTRTIIDELQAKHGAGSVKVQDVAPELRPIVESAVAGKQTFTVDEVGARLSDAFDQMQKADNHFWYGGDGKVQPDELAKAAKKNPAASPLYMRIAQRVDQTEVLRKEMMAAHHAIYDLQRVVTTPVYEAAIQDAIAPFAGLSGREAYDVATRSFGHTSRPALAATKQAWAPLQTALGELASATKLYTHDEKAARTTQALAVVRDLEEKLARAVGHGDAFRTSGALNEANLVLELSQTRPSITTAEKDVAIAAAQERVAHATAALKSVIIEHADGLLMPQLTHMEPAALEAAMVEAHAKLAAAKARLAAVDMDP